MSSFPATSPDVSKDATRVRACANFGSLFTWPSVPIPFPLQVGMPLQHYQPPVLQFQTSSNPHTTLPADNLYYPNYIPTSLAPSREPTPSSTASTTPDLYRALHLYAVNNIPVPNYQHLNMNEPVATQQVAPVASAEAWNVQPTPPQDYHFVENTTTGGPIRRPTPRKRATPYTRPTASTSSSQSSTPASEVLSSSIAQTRLAVKGMCKIGPCRQTFTSADAYKEHVNADHHIRKGKHGVGDLFCPWEGCGERKTKASIWNHILGHNTRSACCICQKELKGTRADSMRRHQKVCPGKVNNGESILSEETSGAYTFFCEA